MSSFLLGMYLVVALLGYIVTYWSEKLPVCPSCCTILLPPSVYKGSNLSTYHPDTCYSLTFWILVILADEKCCPIVVLICISLMTMMLIIFSCASWPFVHLLCRNAYSDPSLIFNLGYLSVYC